MLDETSSRTVVVNVSYIMGIWGNPNSIYCSKICQCNSKVPVPKSLNLGQTLWASCLRHSLRPRSLCVMFVMCRCCSIVSIWKGSLSRPMNSKGDRG